MSIRQSQHSDPLALPLHQAERTACQIIEGKAVVITIDSNELHVLNPVATRIWELADGRALADVIESIVEEFEVSRVRATEDVIRFAQEMLRLGALESQGSLDNIGPSVAS